MKWRMDRYEIIFSHGVKCYKGFDVDRLESINTRDGSSKPYNLNNNANSTSCRHMVHTCCNGKVSITIYTGKTMPGEDTISFSSCSSI